MSTEENKAIARRYLTAHAANTPSILEELLAPDFLAQHATAILDRKKLLHSVCTYSEAFSDRKFIVNDQIAEGDKVTTRTTWEAIHTGDYQGLPATGKRVLIGRIEISRIQNGKIGERWLIMDQMWMLRQLGLVP